MDSKIVIAYAALIADLAEHMRQGTPPGLVTITKLAGYHGAVLAALADVEGK